jgi:hypothetical protein
MKKNYSSLMMAALMATATAMTACSSDDDDNNNNDNNQPAASEGAFVFATTVTSSGETANLLLTSSTIEDGSVSPINNGLVNDGATEWIYFKNKYLYALTYNQGNAGTTRSYILGDDNQMKARSAEYKVSRFTSFGTFGDYIITSSTGDGLSDYADAAGNLPKMLLLTYLDAENEVSTSSDSRANKENLMSENFLGDGEYVTLSGFLESNNKLYVGVVPMGLSVYGASIDGGKYVKAGNEDLVKTEAGGTSSSAYVKGELQYTQYPNRCCIAIFDNEKLEGKKIITTDKISYPTGRYKSQYYQTIRQADNGDIYVFSPSFAKTMTDPRQQTTLPAGVVRIKSGATEFDSNYYYNIEAQADGKSFQRCLNAGGSCFLLQMYSAVLTSNQQVANELAIFNGETGKLTYVTGLPETNVISGFSKNTYVEDGYVYIAIYTSDNNYPAVYKINNTTGVATKAIELQVSTVAALGRLSK